jgi:hypothetical protein
VPYTRGTNPYPRTTTSRKERIQRNKSEHEGTNTYTILIAGVSAVNRSSWRASTDFTPLYVPLPCYSLGSDLERLGRVWIGYSSGVGLKGGSARLREIEASGRLHGEFGLWRRVRGTGAKNVEGQRKDQKNKKDGTKERRNPEMKSQH